MPWSVEYSDEFEVWWRGLGESEQEDIDAHIHLLEQRGPMLPYPFSSDVKSSRYGERRELRVQSGGRPIRIFYAFDHRRFAILLIGGDKTGDDRFYAKMVPLADRLYREHLGEIRAEIGKEQEIHGRKTSLPGAAGADVAGGKKARGRKGPKVK